MRVRRRENPRKRKSFNFLATKNEIVFTRNNIKRVKRPSYATLISGVFFGASWSTSCPFFPGTPPFFWCEGVKPFKPENWRRGAPKRRQPFSRRFRPKINYYSLFCLFSSGEGRGGGWWFFFLFGWSICKISKFKGGRRMEYFRGTNCEYNAEIRKWDGGWKEFCAFRTGISDERVGFA